MMEKSWRKFYFSSLGVLLALSAYPVILGIKIIILQLQNGSIRPEDYARYVIPYTAICLSILISVGLYPVLAKLRRFSNLAATVLGLGLFIGFELYMESITINSPIARSTVEWQLFSCIGTPAAIQAFQKPYSDAYKIHYFLVSFVIIVLIISLFYGYGNWVAGKVRSNRISLRLQLISTVLLLGLCVFANLTGFFRNTAHYLSPLSSFLTGTFFIVLGVSLGIYVGSYLVGRRKVISIVLPAVAAALTCSLMYYGEFKLLDGELYRFGRNGLFEGLPYITVSPVDLVIIALSGLVTALLMDAVEKKHRYLPANMDNHIDAG